MRPLVGDKNRVRRLKKVVLPAPLGPMSAWIVPRFTARLTFLTAMKPAKDFVSRSARIRISSDIAAQGRPGLLRSRRVASSRVLLAPYLFACDQRTSAFRQRA